MLIHSSNIVRKKNRLISKVKIILLLKRYSMNWIDLFNAFESSKEMPQKGYYVVTFNPVYREYNGNAIEVSSDSHTLCIELGDDFSGNYNVQIRIDCNARVTATIDILGVGKFDFPVTDNDEHFDKRVQLTPCLSNFDKIDELHNIFDWIFKVYKSIII